MVQNKRTEVSFCYFTIIFLGFWLLLAPSTFGYVSRNDRIVGVIFIISGLLSLSKRGWLFPWIIVLGGVWLQAAPLIFWAKSPALYLNDTMVGVLAIAFAWLIPVKATSPEKGHEIPPGWSYNPSAWIQRVPIIALACVGWFIARYLAAYELGFVDHVWDPIFGNGTKLVLTSKISKAFPIPDAGLGALAYTLEAILGCKGGSARWRKEPWMVILFAFLVVPLGIISIILVILQPVLVGAWCFLCLLAAFSMLIMVVLTLDEMVATIQFLCRSEKPFWQVFWKGGDIKGAKTDDRTPPFTASPIALIKTWRFGIGFRWNLILTTLLGFYIMSAPKYFVCCPGYENIDHVVSALVVVVSIISLAEVARSLRYLLIPLAITLAIFFTPAHVLFAIILIILSLPKGPLLETHGY